MALLVLDEDLTHPLRSERGSLSLCHRPKNGRRRRKSPGSLARWSLSYNLVLVRPARAIRGRGLDNVRSLEGMGGVPLTVTTAVSFVVNICLLHNFLEAIFRTMTMSDERMMHFFQAFAPARQARPASKRAI